MRTVSLSANSGKRYVSGLRYITSGGESSKVSGAKSGLVYALIGIAIAVLAQVIAHYALSAANSSIK